jgi:hypothetical protein
MCTNRSFYDTYDSTYLDFVTIFHNYCSCCYVTRQSLADGNRMCWPSYSLIAILLLSHGAFDPCTCTDEWSCLTIWSLKSRKSWHIAKLVMKSLLTRIWRQKLRFAYLFLRTWRCHQHVFVQMPNLYGEKLEAICRRKSLQVQLASLAATVTNQAPQLAQYHTCSYLTPASPNLA